jgi:radical SAM/Cys-rich protein
MSVDFAATVAAAGQGVLRRGVVSTVQINVGKVCNQACHHCHVDAGPKRTESMSAAVAEAVIALVARHPEVAVVDVTGGAPELNPNFRGLVTAVRRLGRRVIDRCNLTVLYEPGQESLAEFLAAEQVEIVASLPCYGPENVDQQRGQGVFAKSIRALRHLNALGYGQPGSAYRLDLVYNPVGATLPPAQAALEADYRRQLRDGFGIEFHQLLTITNMPISRFAAALERSGALQAYMGLLVNHFNPATLDELMCRSLLSVGWDGRLYDCDFNQMLDLPLDGPLTIDALTDLAALRDRPIVTGTHCFGCTAGAGSSCGGALA